MKRILLLSAGLLFIISVMDIMAQKLISNSSVTGVCYAGNKINRIYIPPPKGVIERIGSKGGGTIKVNYSGFTPSAQSAVEYAVGILEAMLPADANVYVKASWTKISSSGVLGNSSITGFAAGWGIDALLPNAFYPVTLAEKIAGEGLNEDFEADVELVINNSVNWYLGTDGNTPTNRYDLVTVVIHELCHGLGFFDSMSAENSLGTYGLGSIPIVYDTFVENLTEERLTDTLEFKLNSTALYQELTGGQLYFAGPLTARYLSGVRPRLYAPPTWDPGSSVSHLDELRTLPENSLMTPFIDLGEAIHDPGKLTFSILGDLGWINTRISPGKLKDTEEFITEIEVTASIQSDTVYNRNSVGLVYSFDGFTTADTLLMTSISSDDNYSRTIPVPGYNVRFEYYIFAEDDFLRLYKSPSRAEEEPYTVFIGIDTVKPVISHIPNEYYFERVDSILFNATITDNLGIDTAWIEYNINNGPARFFGLSYTEKDIFSTNFNVKHEELQGGDLLNYRIVAIDEAAGRNTRVSPSAGFHTIKIEALGSVAKSYSTDFTSAAGDFFNSGFEITQPSGFNSASLNSAHPYVSPEQDDVTLDFSSVLRHPIIFDASGMVISYRELVLVEPGAEGSIYGFSDFYDYVIIEGSKNFGKTWFGLADGYDSRFLSTWETAYNSEFDEQNSTFKGTESMMITHTLYPRVPEYISSGDSILLRFRLFSDPYANGWGWVIDDLEIGPIVDGVEEPVVNDLIVYPNPGRGLVNIGTGNNNSFNPLRISVYNSTGQRLIDRKVSPDDELQVDISNYPSGIYFIVVEGSAGIRTFKYSLIK